MPRLKTILWMSMAGAALVAVAISLAFQSRSRAISQSEATRLAEVFVAANGYTDLPPDRSRLTPEPIVLSAGVEEELNSRRDRLERAADGASGGEDGWVIYFRYKRGGGEMRRAVVIDAKGSHIHIVHQDAY